MKNVIFLIFAIAALIFTACDKDDDSPGTIAGTYYCDFEQDDDSMDGWIDDDEHAIMTDCYENRLKSKSEVESNLIGEWELIGHGEGWIPSISQPCGYITIKDEAFIFEFENANIDTLTRHTWEVKENPASGVPYLELTPRSFSPLFVTFFCAEYMYGDATPVDGNMYLYQKVN